MIAFSCSVSLSILRCFSSFTTFFNCVSDDVISPSTVFALAISSVILPSIKVSFAVALDVSWSTASRICCLKLFDLSISDARSFAISFSFAFARTISPARFSAISFSFAFALATSSLRRVFKSVVVSVTSERLSLIFLFNSISTSFERLISASNFVVISVVRVSQASLFSLIFFHISISTSFERLTSSASLLVYSFSM